MVGQGKKEGEEEQIPLQGFEKEMHQ